jgi:hypothetical protein
VLAAICAGAGTVGGTGWVLGGQQDGPAVPGGRQQGGGGSSGSGGKLDGPRAAKKPPPIDSSGECHRPACTPHEIGVWFVF